jgi:light-regulated signal transduction histidine kinase (bacteriophytochrome)
VLREVQDAAGELRRRNHELETVAKSMTQNLRSPMAAIGALSSLLSQELRSHRGDKVADYLERLKDGARCGEQLVDGVLELTEIACMNFAPEPLDISQMARDLMLEREQAGSPRRMSISVEDGLRAWGDPGLVRMVMRHLLDNAWKFTSRQQDAAITVGAEIGPEGEPVFFVRDSGCGFDAAKAGNLFRKFQRLHPPGEFPGGGVGLVVVGRVIDRHGGRVWADSRPAQGTIVYFTLPNRAHALKV